MIDRIRKYFANRKARAKVEKEQFFANTLALGFDKIEFPIIIQEGSQLSIIGDQKHFFGDPDIYFFEFDSGTKLIDVNGRQFTCGYHIGQRANYPDKFIKQLTVDELRELARQYLTGSEKKPTLGGEKTIGELFEKMWDYC